MTLQPEWRKQAKAAGATDITCENGDPFYMILRQLNSVIIGWVESGVNDLLIHPINREVVHEINEVIDDIPIPDFEQIGKDIKGTFQNVGGKIKSGLRRSAALNPLNWLAPSYRAETAARPRVAAAQAAAYNSRPPPPPSTPTSIPTSCSRARSNGLPTFLHPHRVSPTSCSPTSASTAG